MSVSPPPSAARYLPDWTIRRLVLLERTSKWAAPVQEELNLLLRASGPPVQVESCQTSRDAMDLLELRNTVGLILFPAGVEKECCHLLGRLPALSQEPPTLVVADDSQRSILPVFLEAGPTSLLMNVQSDRPIADWCQRVVQTNL